MHSGSLWVLLASQSAGGSLQWWQVATGVLGIPAAVVTILGGWRISQKTRLEAQKLQLEIQEKHEQARPPEASVPGHEPVSSLAGVTPGGLVFIGDVLTRFVILYLLLYAWGLIESLIYPLVSFALSELNLPHSGVFGLGLNYITLILDLPRYLIYALIGWPLLTDIARRLGFTPRNLLRKPEGSW